MPAAPVAACAHRATYRTIAAPPQRRVGGLRDIAIAQTARLHFLNGRTDLFTDARRMKSSQASTSSVPLMERVMARSITL
jgi:hypothetical protein